MNVGEVEQEVEQTVYELRDVQLVDNTVVEAKAAVAEISLIVRGLASRLLEKHNVELAAKDARIAELEKQLADEREMVLEERD